MSELILLGMWIVSMSLLFLQSVLRKQDMEYLKRENEELQRKFDNERRRLIFYNNERLHLQKVVSLGNSLKVLSPPHPKASLEEPPRESCPPSSSPSAPPSSPLSPRAPENLQPSEISPLPIFYCSHQSCKQPSEYCMRQNTTSTSE